MALAGCKTPQAAVLMIRWTPTFHEQLTIFLYHVLKMGPTKYITIASVT